MGRYRYAIGEYLTYEEAEEALEDLLADGEVSPGEDPAIQRNKHQYSPYAITIEARP